MRHYLINNDEVRHCPNAQCDYAGLVEIDYYTGRIECETPLECPECETTWKDPLQKVTNGIFLARKWVSFSRYCEATVSNLRKLMMARPCPFCGVMI